MQTKGKVLLTGITGFVGSHLAIQLLEKGYEVRGTLRNANRIDAIRAVIAGHTDRVDKLSFVEADLTKPGDWPTAMQGIDWVQHIASPLPSVMPKDHDTLIRPAREGVLNVLTAARDAGIKRVVLTSSIASIQHGVTKRKLFTEADWSDASNLKDNTAYTRSKTIAERAAWKFMEEEGGSMELAVVNPGLVLGPLLEKDYSSSIEFVKKLMERAMPAVPKLGYSMVDVRSVADLHVLAMEKPAAAGQRFICTEAFYSFQEVGQLLQEKYPNRKIPTGILPTFLLRIFALIDKKVAPVLIELGSDRRHDNTKARELLGWKPIPMAQSVVDTAESLVQFELV